MIEQGTNEWLLERCGKATASRIADIMARTKTGYGASRASYAAQLITERLTGCIAPSFTNSAMQHGTMTEPEARRAYEFYADCDVEQVGFIPHPTIGMAGASPDGLVEKDGLVEIKCPQSATHIDTLLSGTVPEKYIKQMHFQMMCCERQWCDFASYDPRFPERMRLFVKRVHRDEELVDEIAVEVCTFLSEIDAKTNALNVKFAHQLEEAA